MAQSEISDLSETDGDNTSVSDWSTDGSIANMSTTDNVFQAILGMLKRWFKSSLFRLRDSTDQTKLLAFDLSGLTTATTRTVEVPDENGIMVTANQMSGAIYALVLSNNASDATNDIDITAGVCVDRTNAKFIRLSSAITKRLDAAWAAGNGNGGLDTGSISNATYHVHVIKNPTTGTVDALFSLNPATPTMPSGYTLNRRVGSIIRDSGAILKFKQDGDVFMLDTPVLAVDAQNPGTSAVTRALQVPGGISPLALVTAHLLDVTASTATGAYISDLSLADATPTPGVVGQLFTDSKAGASALSVSNFAVRTNSNRQVRTRVSASDADIFLRITSNGWIDERGRA